MPQTGNLEPRNVDLLQDPSRNEYLSDKDVEIVRGGLRLLAERLGGCRPWNLPSAVLFTETSARPFAYAFKPMLEKLYTANGLPAPQMLFILTQHHSDLAYEILKPDFEWEKSWDVAVAKTRQRVEQRIVSYERRLAENDFSIRQSEDESLEECRVRFKDVVAEGKQWLKALPVRREAYSHALLSIERRLNQVATGLADGGRKPQLLIVDEHVYSAGTLRMLEAAYRGVKRDVPRLRIDFFAFIDGRVDASEGREGGFRRALGRRFFATSSGFDSFRYTEADGLKPTVVGVAKSLDRDTVFRAPQRDPAKMRFLRQLLRQIGEEVAASL